MNLARVLGAYLKSCMVTVKWHMLYHVADEIVTNSGLYLCGAGQDEYSITIFNKSYFKTSKQRTYDMEESIAIVERRIGDGTTNLLLKGTKIN